MFSVFLSLCLTGLWLFFDIVCFDVRCLSSGVDREDIVGLWNMFCFSACFACKTFSEFLIYIL